MGKNQHRDTSPILPPTIARPEVQHAPTERLAPLTEAVPQHVATDERLPAPPRSSTPVSNYPRLVEFTEQAQRSRHDERPNGVRDIAWSIDHSDGRSIGGRILSPSIAFAATELKSAALLDGIVKPFHLHLSYVVATTYHVHDVVHTEMTEVAT